MKAHTRSFMDYHSKKKQMYIKRIKRMIDKMNLRSSVITKMCTESELLIMIQNNSGVTIIYHDEYHVTLCFMGHYIEINPSELNSSTIKNIKRHISNIRDWECNVCYQRKESGHLCKSCTCLVCNVCYNRMSTGCCPVCGYTW